MFEVSKEKRKTEIELMISLIDALNSIERDEFMLIVNAALGTDYTEDDVIWAD